MNWYKKAKSISLQFLSYIPDYGQLRVAIDGSPYTYYNVPPPASSRIKWMIEKSRIPHEVILQKHLKQFSDTEKHKELNQVPKLTDIEKDEIMDDLEERGMFNKENW